MTVPLLDVDAARISPTPDGGIEVDDPNCPWLVQVWPHTQGGRTYLRRVAVQARDPRNPPGLAAAALGRLPVAQLLRVAAAAAHPNELYYRMLARPKPAGQRQWGPEHWSAVLTVAGWAVSTARPGGAVRAVADLWGVAADPTAHRWLARARRLSREPHHTA